MNNINSNLAFKGVYKMTAPKVDAAKNEQEKAALTDCITNCVVMGCNMSVVQPKVNKEEGALYFKIDDKNDKDFENGFKTIVNECNKKFNTDLAKTVYVQKTTDADFNKAEVLS